MDRYQQKLSAYKNVSAGSVLLAGDDLSSTPRVLIALVAGFTIFIQRIVVSVTTDNAATLSFQDSAGTPVVAAKTKASPGLGVIVYDFGPEGFALTEGKELDLKNSAAGLAAVIEVQAYQKATGVTTLLVGNQVGGGTPGTNHS